MTTVNYPTPVIVNGYSCKNCTDVDYAKQHIDPAHPKDGPYGVDAKDQPAKPSEPSATPSGAQASSPAITFGGLLAGASAGSNLAQPLGLAQGQRLDISA
jgi:hypothetical protein